MAKKYRVSPKGRLKYAWLTKSDTKFKAEGMYHTKLVVAGDDEKGRSFIETIDAAIAAAFEDAKKQVAKMPIKNGKKPKAKLCEDKVYSTNEDGDIEFSFKMTASGTNKKTGEDFIQRPALFDSNNKPITDESIRIGGGTVAKISYEIVPFFTTKIGAGVSLRMRAVQIIELVEFGGDGEYYGFGEEGGGFEQGEDADEETAAEEFEGEDEQDDEDDEEGEEEEAPAPSKKSNAKKSVSAPAPVAATKTNTKKTAVPVNGKRAKPVANNDEEDF